MKFLTPIAQYKMLISWSRKKKIIRSMAHHFSIGELPPDQFVQLKGLLAFAISKEPQFVGAIGRMIGEKTLLSLIKGETQ